MEYKFTVDDGKSMAYLTIRGECEIRELESMFLAVVEDKRFDSEFNVLTDIGDCTFTFRPAEMSEFFRMFNEEFQGRRGKSAILVSKPHETALAMVHGERVSETRTISVFSTREEALKWLNQETGD